MRFSCDLRRLVLLPFLLALLPIATTSCGGNDDAPPASQVALSVTGDVSAPANLEVVQIRALPATTQTVSFGSGSGPQTHTYIGTGLRTLLNQIGIVTNPAVHNDLLGKYVVATGSDNYRVLFAMGELSPDFGNRGNLVAYAETINGANVALTTDGPLRVTAPGDIKGGRYVSNLVRLEVRNGDPHGNGISWRRPHYAVQAFRCGGAASDVRPDCATGTPGRDSYCGREHLHRRESVGSGQLGWHPDQRGKQKRPAGFLSRRHGQRLVIAW